MNASSKTIVVAIATPLEAELVAAIAAVDDRFDVRYEPAQSPELFDAEIVFGFPGDSPRDLAKMVTSNARLRWVQATVRGAGEQVRAARLTESELIQVQITRTQVHVAPLAEFAMFGVLAFAKNLPGLLHGARTRSWEHVPMSELSDQTLLVIGLGSTGVEVARLGSAFGMSVVGVNRHGRGKIPGVEAIRPPRFLGDLLPTAHAVVVTLPLTEQTRGMIDAAAISRMRTDSVLVNVGAGGVIDEEALIDGLEHGQPAGAVLDAFAMEPLLNDSPLWCLPNVVISPHTVERAARENERIVASFIQNLRRYLRGDDLLGLMDTSTLD